MDKDSPLTDEELDTWDVLNTPVFESTHDKIKRKINQASHNYLFELNDDVTRQMLSEELNMIFSDLVNDKVIKDYQIVCDETNNAAQVIDQGILRVDVFVKEDRSPKFIHIPVTINTL